MSITKLPTAATSYVEVRKARGLWLVEIVTPMPGRPLRTGIASGADYDAARLAAEETAKLKRRPLRLPKGART